MFDLQTTRLFPGLTNTKDTGIFSDLYVPDRISKIHEYVQDFDQYIAADYVLTLGGGAVTQTSGDGGLITLVSAASAITSLQKTPAAFRNAAGFRTWGKFVLGVDSLLGLVIAGTLNVTATPFTGASQTDGIYFTTATTGVITANIASGGVITSVVVPNTLLVAGGGLLAHLNFYWDGAIYGSAPNGRIMFDVSGTGVTAPSRVAIALPSGTTFPTAVLTTPTVGVSATTAAARTLTLDTIWVAKDRINPNATPAF